MTGTILVEVVKHLNVLGVYDWSKGEHPLMILDGHEFRFQRVFVDYINNPETKWFMIIGVPYLTHLWQLANSPELNGSFKTAWVHEKRELVQHRRHLGQAARLYPTNIMLLLSRAIARSFFLTESNKKVLVKRG